MEKWLIWDGTVWKIVDQGKIIEKGKETIRSLFLQAGNIEDSGRSKALGDWTGKSLSLYRIKSMLELSQSSLPILAKDLDTQPLLFNCENGTYDLEKAEFRRHQKQDFLTKKAPVAFDINAKCPEWESFVFDIFQGDEELIKYIQKAVGYTMTGYTKEQVIFILYGTGNNGKSTLLNVLHGIFGSGEYSLNTLPRTILIKPQESGLNNDLARLMNARFVSCAEANPGKRLDESIIKLITGGDYITSRFMWNEYKDKKPSFTVWFATNHRPRIIGTDDAIWRRIREIPFNYKVPEKEKVMDYHNVLLEEKSGILNWIIEGCHQWQDEGLKPPEAVQEATDDYRCKMDRTKEFLQECCIIGPGKKVGVQQLYDRYVSATGNKNIKRSDFGIMLEENGFCKKREIAGWVWVGIGLLEN
jgi:putative DNA primase/helicase